MTEKRSPRILISQLGDIGDTVLTLPILNTLRAHFPSALLAWVVESPADQLLEDHQALDHLIVLPRGWLKSMGRVCQLRRKLRSLDLDLTIDPQSRTKSSLAAWLSGARRRIGFARGVRRELAPSLNTELVRPRRTHVVDKSLELLTELGIRAPRVEFRIPIDQTAHVAVENYVRQTHLGCGYAVLNPGARWHSRRWPAQRYATVARHLGQAHSLPSVVAWVGDEEATWAEQIVDHSGGHALMAPRTTLSELAAMLRSARVYIGSDSGPMHLAAAVGTVCVGLYGPTCPTEGGAYGRQHVAVQARYQGGTGRARRRGENDAMRAIEPEMVNDACDKLLAGASQSGHTNAA